MGLKSIDPQGANADRTHRIRLHELVRTDTRGDLFHAKLRRSDRASKATKRKKCP
jgi:hypothetical protein